MDALTCRLFVCMEEPPCISVTQARIRRELLRFYSVYICQSGFSPVGSRELFLSR